jgi:uncharacterized protein (DUF934 family)
MALIKNNALVEDAFVDASHAEGMPEHGAVIVSLEQWQARRDELAARGTPLGIRLRSDQTPALVADDLERFALVALEFPRFRDGRAYSYARLLRERYGFKGELRAVGDVLMEQLLFMLRVGTAALGGEGDERVVSEIADLWFHTMVLLAARGIPLRRVFQELARRHQPDKKGA